MTNTIAVRLAVSVSLVSLFLFNLSVQAASSSKSFKVKTSVSREFQQADQTLQTGRYDAAETQYMALLKKDPNNVQARSAMALAQAELYKLDSAEKNARLALAKDPKNAMAYAALGTVLRNRTASLDLTYKSQRDWLLAQSAQNLQHAESLAPNTPEVHNQLGETYRMQGRYTQAQQEFDTALHYDPQFAEALVNSGVTRMQQGDTQGAKLAYQKAIQLNSKNYNAYYHLGDAYLKANDTHRALQTLNTALSLSPNNPAILTKMAEANQRQGNSSAAIANYHRAILGNPAFMPAYTGIANIYDSQGDGELAMSQLKSALNVNPHYSQGRNQLAHLALTVDKPDQAAQYYQQSLQENPHDPAALEGLSQALTVQAQKTATESAVSGQDSSLVDAQQSIHQALQLNPNDLGLHLAALRIDQLAGQPQASDAELQRIVSQPAQNDNQRVMQGEAYYALGQYPQSDAIFNQLIQNAHGNPKRLLLLGDTLKADGNLQMARQAYQAVPPGNIKAQRALDRIQSAESDSHKSLRLANALNHRGPLGFLNHNEQQSSIDYYEESLAKDPRQPEARLELAKLYEKFKEYDKAAQSYRYFMALSPQLTQDDQQYYEKKINKMQELAQKQGYSSNQSQ